MGADSKTVRKNSSGGFVVVAVWFHHTYRGRACITGVWSLQQIWHPQPQGTKLTSKGASILLSLLISLISFFFF